MKEGKVLIFQEGYGVRPKVSERGPERTVVEMLNNDHDLFQKYQPKILQGSLRGVTVILKVKSSASSNFTHAITFSFRLKIKETNPLSHPAKKKNTHSLTSRHEIILGGLTCH